jgi:uncharacterized repeat protein (TIGR01451 family)
MKTKLNKLLNYGLGLSGLFLALAMHSGFAYAEQAQAAPSTEVKKEEPLAITLTAQKVTKDAKGKEVFSKADKVKPGDVVEYGANYANVSEAALNGVLATLPVPKGMEYIDRSANPATVTATLDGVKFEAVPLKRIVKDKSGKEVTQLVPVTEYRALRWALDEIQVKKATTVSARMLVAK